ncbi:MAG: glycerol kinase GlpK [Lachnospiraceae bacterium]|nr:glycerol kinase GlpK [Lachnospiraceae bacterium]
MSKYVMALDQGTTSSRCILFDREGRIASLAQREFTQYFPKPGWVEHDPMEIWSTQLAVAIEAAGKVGAAADDIAAIGITNQRETTIVWDRKTGVPVYNAIVWQCRRTADRIRQLSKEPAPATPSFAENPDDRTDCIPGQEYGDDRHLGSDATKPQTMADYAKSVTGLIPDAYFCASKIEWILDHVEGARARAQAGDLLFGTVDTWLIWRLTGGRVHVTDYTNASRTMLFDIHKLCWDPELLACFHIPAQMLPEVKPSGCLYGYTDLVLLGSHIPIAGAAGDQQAALFGQCCFAPGDVKNTYGTGCFLLMNTGSHAVDSKNGLLTTIAAGTRRDRHEIQYALEGSVFVAGAGIQWLRDEMQLIPDAASSETLARSVPDTAGVYIVPTFTGIGAPYWNPYVRGTVVGLTRGCTKAHFVRAMLESLAWQSRDVMKAMENEAGTKIRDLKVDGGASRNDFLMQFQADILDAKVLRPACVETTALGAAYLAGLTVGYWKDTDEIRENWALAGTFTPQMQPEQRSERIRGWEQAVRCALYWAEESSHSC